MTVFDLAHVLLNIAQNLLERNQPEPYAAADRIGPILRAELGEDRGDVKLHRVLADGELRRNGSVRQSFREDLEDFELARGQRFVDRRFSLCVRQWSPSHP